MINLFEFKIIGPNKFYQFKLTNTDKNIIDWVKIIEGMVSKINQKMNDLKIMLLNKSLVRNQSNLINKLSESQSNRKDSDRIKISSSQNNISDTYKDKTLFKISESQEDEEYTENSSNLSDKNSKKRIKNNEMNDHADLKDLKDLFNYNENSNKLDINDDNLIDQSKI